MWKVIIYNCDHLKKKIMFSDTVNSSKEDDIFMFPSRKCCFCDTSFSEITFNFMNVKMKNKTTNFSKIFLVFWMQFGSMNAMLSQLRKCFSVKVLIYCFTPYTPVSLNLGEVPKWFACGRMFCAIGVKTYDVIRMWYLYFQYVNIFLLHAFCAIHWSSVFFCF